MSKCVMKSIKNIFLIEVVCDTNETYHYNNNVIIIFKRKYYN